MMVSEVGQGGDWTRAFEASHMDKFDAPTVEGIDFPSMGVRQAWNDVTSGTLYVGTYAVTPDRRGLSTTWRVTNLPNPDDVFVICDGEPFDRVTVEGPGTIRIESDIDSHQYQIFTDYRGRGTPRRDARLERRGTAGSAALASAAPQPARANDARQATSEFFSGGGPTCSCC